jgi:hypothetical protein
MYIDPGSGSTMLQLLIASALGSCFAFRKSLASLWARISHWRRPHTGDR